MGEEQAYVNPEIAEEEKKMGNELFKAGDFAGAVKKYSEAIRRNPTDAKIYSNRAACFTKLLSFDLALKDCDKCIELDPAFVKAYLRKAKAHQAMGQTSKAMSAYEKALEIDSNCSEAIEGYKNCAIQNNSDPEEVRKRAMNDPEVQNLERSGHENDPGANAKRSTGHPRTLKESSHRRKIHEIERGWAYFGGLQMRITLCR